MGRVRSYRAFSPLPRRSKLHIVRFAASGKAHSLRCSSFPHRNLGSGGAPDWDGKASSISFASPQKRQSALISLLFLSPIGGTRRYLSVALVLGSPPAGVTRYPCPAEPGLSSRGAFRPPPAAVQPGRQDIVTHSKEIVKCLAKSFLAGYTIDRNLRGEVPYGGF